MKIYTGFI